MDGGKSNVARPARKCPCLLFLRRTERCVGAQGHATEVVAHECFRARMVHFFSAPFILFFQHHSK